MVPRQLYDAVEHAVSSHRAVHRRTTLAYTYTREIADFAPSCPLVSYLQHTACSRHPGMATE